MGPWNLIVVQLTLKEGHGVQWMIFQVVNRWWHSMNEYQSLFKYKYRYIQPIVHNAKQALKTVSVLDAGVFIKVLSQAPLVGGTVPKLNTWLIRTSSCYDHSYTILDNTYETPNIVFSWRTPKRFFSTNNGMCEKTASWNPNTQEYFYSDHRHEPNLTSIDPHVSRFKPAFVCMFGSVCISSSLKI